MVKSRLVVEGRCGSGWRVTMNPQSNAAPTDERDGIGMGLAKNPTRSESRSDRAFQWYDGSSFDWPKDIPAYLCELLERVPRKLGVSRDDFIIGALARAVAPHMDCFEPLIQAAIAKGGLQGETPGLAKQP
jgi:hypothetical protein